MTNGNLQQVRDLHSQLTSAHNALLERVAHLQDGRSDSQLVRFVKQEQLLKQHRRPINSLVFLVEDSNANIQPPGYILAVLESNDKVDTEKLGRAVATALGLKSDESKITITLSLAPSDIVSQLCGFPPGCIPPLGLSPPPLITMIEHSLANDSGTPGNDNNVMLIGGGGLPEYSMELSITALLDYATGVQIAEFRQTTHQLKQKVTNIEHFQGILKGHESEKYQKPFFAVAPPDTAIAQQIIHGQTEVALSSEWVAVVGRISGVRQMSRRHVFVDLSPPIVGPNQSAVVSDRYPWRCPKSGDDMAVQLIVGESFCRRRGVDEPEKAIRKLKGGQLIMVQGKTNMDKISSLKNWCAKKSLDVVVYDYQHLQTDADSSVWGIPSSTRVVQDRGVNNVKDGRELPVLKRDELPILKLRDLYPNSVPGRIVEIVENLASVKLFHSKVSNWLDSHPNEAALVGIDCEWKPSFLAEHEAQPVLLLQICFHPLQRVYLIDTQELLRPLEKLSADLTELELAVSDALGQLFQSDRLVKVGYQLADDFRRLAASYPQCDSFQEILSVLEISNLGQKVMQMKKLPRARVATSSLAKMTERFVSFRMNKTEQVSDWSVRPLLPEQVEYAALDAAVTPAIAERLIGEIRAHFCTCPVSLQRRNGDTAFAESLLSYKFHLYPSTETAAIQKWNAKRLVGDYFLVSQTWTATEPKPDIPTILDNGNGHDSPFVDLKGITRIPSHTIAVNRIDMGNYKELLLGRYVAKAKDDCVMALIEASGNNDGVCSIGGKLHCAQRLGYVELANAVVLFVTMPVGNAQTKPRSYPNEWIDNGAMMSWFIKEHDWKNGTTMLGRKMTRSGKDESAVILFVRRGHTAFLCCGRCELFHLDKNDDKANEGGCSDQWNIIKFFLRLNDFAWLQTNTNFQYLVHPGESRRVESWQFE